MVAHTHDPERDAPGEPIVSPLAANPVFADLVAEFADSLPDRLHQMRRLLDAGDFNGLARLAHCLKGAGGGYGYPQLTEVAGCLEQTASAADPHGTRDAILQLARLSRRIQAGRTTPHHGPPPPTGA